MTIYKEQQEKFDLFNMTDVAQFFGYSEPAIRSWIRNGMPRHQSGRNGKNKTRYRYNAMEIARWLRKSGPWKKRYDDVSPDSQSSSMTEEQLLATAPDTPAMERLRLAKAKMAEIELEKMRRTVVVVEIAKGLLIKCSSVIRLAGEKLGAEFGRGAQKILNDALDECERVIVNERDEQMADVPDNNRGHSSSQGSSGPHNGAVGRRRNSHT